MSSSTKINIPKSRQIIYSIITITAFFATAELGARMLDAKYNFRGKLLEALSSIEPNINPVKARDTLPWPDSEIAIRAPATFLKKEIYLVGGKIIPGGHTLLKKRIVKPADIKDNGRKRVFIIGASAAFGFPYTFEYSFATLLNNKFGDKYDFINAAQISWTTGDLVPLVHRIIDHYKPDVFIIFAGNNEWSHWRVEEAVGNSRKILATYRFLAKSRIIAGGLYFKLKHSQKDKLRKWVIEDLMFKQQKELTGFEYAAANPAEKYFKNAASAWLRSKDDFLDTFEENILEMVNASKEKNIKVILMTMPFNYRVSPAFTHPQPESFNPVFKAQVRHYLHEALGLVREKKYNAAFDAVNKGLSLDPYPPLLLYLKAYCLEKMGKLDIAQQIYEEYRDNRIGHLGCPSCVDKRIKEVAKQTGSGLVDLKKIFDDYERSIGGHFNEHLIDDDCHPTPVGQRLIAKSLFKFFNK